MNWDSRGIRTVVRRLERLYGRPVWQPRYEPLDELICTILTQHTSDVNAIKAFESMRSLYPDWDDIVEMPRETLSGIIRSAGLSNQKAKSIQAVLREIHLRLGSYSLDVLAEMPLEEARRWLMSLPGVGPKTAAIVLCFSFGFSTIPVDTHVFRLMWRLGIIEKKLGEAKAHVVAEKIVPKALAFRFHVALITHGRKICKSLRPRCEDCPLIDMCLYYKEQHLARTNV